MHESEKVIFQVVLKRSLGQTSEVGLSGVTPDSTILRATETSTDGPVESSMPPQVILLSGIDALLEASPPYTPDESVLHV